MKVETPVGTHEFADDEMDRAQQVVNARASEYPPENVIANKLLELAQHCVTDPESYYMAQLVMGILTCAENRSYYEMVARAQQEITMAIMATGGKSKLTMEMRFGQALPSMPMPPFPEEMHESEGKAKYAHRWRREAE